MRFDHRQVLKRRKLLALSQEEVAQKAGLTQEIVSRVELGRNQSSRTFKKLCKALGLKLEDLLIEDEEQPAEAAS